MHLIELMLGILLQLVISIVFFSFIYNAISRKYLNLKGKGWSTTIPEMLKEDRVTARIFLSTGIVLCGISIIINIFYKFLPGSYSVSFFLLFIGTRRIVFPNYSGEISTEDPGW
jgi:hypothetical protein